VFSPCWARNSLLGPIPCWARPAGLLPAACPLLPGLLLRRWRRSVAPCGCSTTTLLAPRDGGSWKAAGAWAEGSRRCSMVDGAAAGGAQASLPVALVGSLEQYPYAKGEPGAKFLELNKVTLTPTQHIVFGFAWLLTVRHCHCVNRATACRCVKGVADGERPPSRALPSAAAITATTTATTAVHAHELPPATVQMRRCTSTCRSAATTIRSGRP
jgi:hypothetical protein